MYYDPTAVGVGLGSDSEDLANVLCFDGNPIPAPFEKTYRRYASMEEYGDRVSYWDYFAISHESDADRLIEGILDDVAYPEPRGFVQFYRGDAGLRVGDLLEFRGAPLRRIERRVEGEWDDRFGDALVGRVRRITHRFSGREISTTAWLTSPLRSVSAPLSFMTRSQLPAANLYQFRLDDAAVGVDMGYHLD